MTTRADMITHFLRRWRILAGPVLICNMSGCATFLSVKEIAPEDKEPHGIAVNTQANYIVEAKIMEDGTTQSARTLSSGLLNGIDEKKMLSINATRMPFASGTLQLKVTKEG